jgi:CBS domain-containing protein
MRVPFGMKAASGTDERARIAGSSRGIVTSATTQRGRPIRELMTPAPHAVTVEHTVEDVLQRMRSLGVRHLPITDGGSVVGMACEGELAAFCQGGRGDPSLLAVGEVVESGACVVAGPDMPLLGLVQTMAERKTECCAVVEHGQLIGLLTANDLLHVLSRLLFFGSDARHGLRPSDVRARILAEHDVLRELYARIEALALRVLADESDAEGPLRERCRELYQALLRHIELENTILVPALRETNAFGPVRAQNLLAEHERQRQVLLDALTAAEATASEADVARGVLVLIGELLTDMAHEEQALLHPDLLKDDPIAVDVETG